MVKTLFNKSEWRFLHSEWRFLHSEWRKVSGTQFTDNVQKKSWKRFSKIWTEKSPFRMEKSPFTFFWEAFCISFFKKRSVFYFKSSWKTLIYFFWMEMIFQYFFWPGRSEINKKNTNYSFFSIQNGEISILNWRFLHSFFFRSVLNLFLKKISTENFLHLKN